MTWLRERFLIVGAFVLGAGLLTAVGLLYLANRTINHLFVVPVEQKVASDVGRVIPRFRADLEALATHAFFHREANTADAGAFLNERLPWSTGVAPHSKDYPGDGTFALVDAQETLARLFPRNRPLTDAEAATLAALDFGWMSEIRRFGEWSLSTDYPVAGKPPRWFHQDAVPRAKVLQSWAKLRLLHGRHTKTVTAASEDVAHLAWLLLRTESHLLGIVGTAILTDLARADVGDQRTHSWARFTKDDAKRLSRVALAGPSFFYPTIDVDTQRALVVQGRTAEGLWRVWGCPALVEAWMFTTELGPLLKTRVPQHYAFIDEVVTSEQICRLKRLKLSRQYLEDGHAGDILASIGNDADAGDSGDTPSFSWLAFARFVPMVREMTGGVLFAIGVPSFIQMYAEDDQREPLKANEN